MGRAGLAAEQRDVQPVLQRPLSVMGGHVFLAGVAGLPTGVFYTLVKGSLPDAAFALPGGMSLAATAVEVHAMKLVRKGVTRRAVENSKKGVPLELLQREEGEEVVVAERVAGP